MNRKHEVRSVPSTTCASKPMLAVEALMLAVENISPADLERLSAEHGLLADAEFPDPLRGRNPREADQKPESKGSESLDKDATPSCNGHALAHKAVRDDVAGALPQASARVFGDSMAGAGIRDGDTIELDHDVDPEDGDIVLADVEGVGRVLRTLRIIGGAQVLKAEHPGVAPIVVSDPGKVTFHGVVVRKPSL